MNRLDCTWILHATENSQIMALVLDINTEPNRDYLTFGDGSFPPNNTIWSVSGAPKIRLVFSESYDMWFQFTSSIITYTNISGFALQLQSFDPEGKITIHILSSKCDLLWRNREQVARQMFLHFAIQCIACPI